MGKIKKEEAAYADLPKIYAFKDERQKEIMLNRNFARVNREIDEMIKSLLNCKRLHICVDLFTKTPHDIFCHGAFSF